MAATDLIRLQGANARAAGVDYFSNPFTSLDRVPPQLGRTLAIGPPKLGLGGMGGKSKTF
jgi:hypothetical protein